MKDRISDRTAQWLEQGGNQVEGITPEEFGAFVGALSARPTLRQTSEHLSNAWNNMSPVMRVMAISFLVGGVGVGLAACGEAFDTDDDYTPSTDDSVKITQVESTNLPGPGIKTIEPEPTQTVTPTTEIMTAQEEFPGSQDSSFLAVPGIPEGFGGTGEIAEL